MISDSLACVFSGVLIEWRVPHGGVLLGKHLGEEKDCWALLIQCTFSFFCCLFITSFSEPAARITSYLQSAVICLLSSCLPFKVFVGLFSPCFSVIFFLFSNMSPFFCSYKIIILFPNFFFSRQVFFSLLFSQNKFPAFSCSSIATLLVYHKKFTLISCFSLISLLFLLSCLKKLLRSPAAS
jgi:hypothetical protein